MMPQLTNAQVALLASLVVGGSFTLNLFFIRSIAKEFRERLARIEKCVGTGGDGDEPLVVRVVKLETINQERRSGLPDRRHPAT